MPSFWSSVANNAAKRIASYANPAPRSPWSARFAASFAAESATGLFFASAAAVSSACSSSSSPG
jgi:hypothetical protein